MLGFDHLEEIGSVSLRRAAVKKLTMMRLGMLDWVRRRARKSPTQPPPAITIGRSEGGYPFSRVLPSITAIVLCRDLFVAELLMWVGARICSDPDIFNDLRSGYCPAFVSGPKPRSRNC